jgi:hypothetical protein
MRKLRKLLAGLSSVAILVTCTGFVSAETTEYTGIDTKQYHDYIDCLYEIANKDMVYEMFYSNCQFNAEEYGKYPPIYGEFANIYSTSSSSSLSDGSVMYIDETYLEFYFDYKAAQFGDKIVYYDTYKVKNPEFTKEELEVFLKENNFKASVSEFTETDEITEISLEFYGMTVSEAEQMSYAIYKVYGIKPCCGSYLTSDFIFNKEYDKQDYISKVNALLSATSNTVTIAGDIDLNNEQGISDIVTLSKFNANPELYPITDSTALANADMNQDGKVDTLDATILIEMALSTYESAV